MDYERIDKPLSGIISPSKLRAKLMGLSPTKKKEGSSSHSSRTSPARAQDSDFVKNGLLASPSQDFDDPGYATVDLCGSAVLNSAQSQNHCSSRENTEASIIKVLQSGRSDSGNSSTVHPLKFNDEENLDYDSNASSSSFEFHKGEKVAQRTLTKSLSRSKSYKWNDAEKWIMNKQASQGNYSKSHNGQSAGNRMLGMNMVRVTPEGAVGYDHRLHARMAEMKRVDFFQPAVQLSLEKNLARCGGEPVPLDLFPQSKDLKEVSTVKKSTTDVAATPAIRAISMRDMGTEMTPVTSQEPSRTATPVGATTPFRSPVSSIPSTPREGEPVTTPVEHKPDCIARYLTEKADNHLSEQDLKLKTRREIVALGMQLGKMNIAAWASKDDKDKSLSPRDVRDAKELERLEFEKRAAAWEEAEKSKYAARYKREEIKIQGWESQQKAKLEEELRTIEAKVEYLRTQSQVKMVRRINMVRKKSEEKRAAAEAQKKCQSEKTAAQADNIRQTGRIPSYDYVCCGLFSL